MIDSKALHPHLLITCTPMIIGVCLWHLDQHKSSVVGFGMFCRRVRVGVLCRLVAFLKQKQTNKKKLSMTTEEGSKAELVCLFVCVSLASQVISEVGNFGGLNKIMLFCCYFCCQIKRLPEK